MKVYGIAGTNGAGKDLVADFLRDKYGFFAASATDMLADGLRQKGWPIDRSHKSKLSAEWRRQYGMSAIVDRAWEQYSAVKNQYQGFVVGSLRHPGEVDKIHQLGGQVIWVDADPKVRYNRIRSANRGNNKGSEDDVSFEDFLAQQEREMHPVGDDATLNIAAVKELSDITIMNNGHDIAEFVRNLEDTLSL